MPVSVAPLTDAELTGLLPEVATRRPAAEELMRRHGEVILSYAGLLCRDRQSAEALLVGSFNRTLDLFEHAATPRPTWIACLAGEARRLAARWADDGRLDALSSGFARWLRHLCGPARSGFVTALRTAENARPLHRALHRLSPSTATEVWHTLLRVFGVEAPATRRALPAPAAPVRQELTRVYLRERNSLLGERGCRHLAARLADAASDDAAVAPELTAHLAACGSCVQTLADLRAVHRWDVAELQERALLRCWEAAPQEPAGTRAEDAAEFPGPPPVAAEVAAAECGASPERRQHRSARHARRGRTAALWAAGLGTLLPPVKAAVGPRSGAPEAPSPTEHQGSAGLPGPTGPPGPTRPTNPPRPTGPPNVRGATPDSLSVRAPGAPFAALWSDLPGPGPRRRAASEKVPWRCGGPWPKPTADAAVHRTSTATPPVGPAPVGSPPVGAASGAAGA
ncbi:hypothetical protein [Kitasatospora sp. NPDC059327]|uniref:hypothetical protein n=1 Tax=Kitasatospora sp. NPDC059327 TaxID=3346803 RepID=UPI00367D532B